MNRESWNAVRAARVPADGLAALAPVRCRPGISVQFDQDVVWVMWSGVNEEVVRCLRPVSGVEFLEQRDSAWYRLGCRIPCAAPPTGAGEPLARHLTPAPARIVPAPASVPSLTRLSLIRGGPTAPATALRCVVSELSRWVDVATTAELAAVQAACFGSTALLRGRKLPTVPTGDRFWGDRVLVPLGYRVDPDWPVQSIRAACSAAPTELVLLDHAGIELIPAAAFASLTRAGLRQALSTIR